MQRCALWLTLTTAISPAMSMAAEIERAPCHDEVDGRAFETQLDAAEGALAEMDVVGFNELADELAGYTLPCMVTPLDSETAARFHRVMALALYAVSEDTAGLSMDAARLAAVEIAEDDSFLPPSHPLRQRPDLSLRTRRVPEPEAGTLLFDGRDGQDRPRDTPAIVQVLDQTGRSKFTAYLGPAEALPPYRAVPRQRNTLLACAGGATALAGGTSTLR